MKVKRVTWADHQRKLYMHVAPNDLPELKTGLKYNESQKLKAIVF